MVIPLCALTGSRADYGHFSSLLRRLRTIAHYDLTVVVTGSHLDPSRGSTVQAVLNDGYKHVRKLPIETVDDSAGGIAQATSQITVKMSDYLQSERPAMLLLYGDRYEAFGASIAAFFHKIPIAHIGGGDTSLGAYDDSLRSCISHFSALHFTTHQESSRKLLSFGVDPQRVFTVGSLAIDSIQATQLASREELEDFISFRLRKRNLLITLHPATMLVEPETELFALLRALEKLEPEFGLIFTYPGVDWAAHSFIDAIEDFCRSRENAVAVPSLGIQMYLTTVSHVDMVVGNSSSGLYEVPVFRKPTIDVGVRQSGRHAGGSVVRVAADSNDIYNAIRNSLDLDFTGFESLYGSGDTSNKIIECLDEFFGGARLGD